MDWTTYLEAMPRSSSVSNNDSDLPRKRQRTIEAAAEDYDTATPRSLGSYTAPTMASDLTGDFAPYQDHISAFDFVHHYSDTPDGREPNTAQMMIERDVEMTNEGSEDDTTMKDSHSANLGEPTDRPSSQMSYEGAGTNEDVAYHDEGSDDNDAEVSGRTMDFADPHLTAMSDGVDEAKDSGDDSESDDTDDADDDDDDDEEEGEEKRDGDEDDDDLFNNTFGPKKSRSGTSHDAQEDVCSSSSSTTSSSEDEDAPRPLSKDQSHSHSSALNQANQHLAGTTATKTATTSSPQISTKPPTTASTPSTTIPPLSPLLKAQTRFHITALSHLPKLPLAPHRYWLGILHCTKTPRTARSENDFVWLKGNRFTTIRTLKNAYATMSARSKEDFELRLEGFGRVREGECVEELAVCGDRRVFFWAVEKVSNHVGGGKKGKGNGFVNGIEGAWEVSRGLIPSSSAVTMTGNGGVGGKGTEVIELD